MRDFINYFLTVLMSAFVSASIFSQDFVHPGAMHTKQGLDYIKEKANSNQEPWKSAYSVFKTSKAASYQGINPKPYTSLDYVAHPRASVDCGSYNKPNRGCNDIVYDGMAAYSLALRFYITEDKRYADKAKDIIMAWSNTYRKNTESNSRLIVSWATPWYVNAAEILRYTPNSGWTTSNTNKFNELLNRFKGYIFWEGRPSNNWMMSSVEARIAIAIFQDDRTAFNNAISKWKQRVKTYIYQKSDGSTPVNPAGENNSFTKRIWQDGTKRTGTIYIDGLCMETCRDISHTKLGVNSLINGAEMAWSQNVDLFSLEKERIKDFAELHAPWMMKTSSPPNNVCDGYLDIISEQAFEIMYNQLHDRLNVNMPQTKKMIDRNRPSRASRWVTKWETLCYAGRPFDNGTNTPPTGEFLEPIFSSIPVNYDKLYFLVDANDLDGDAISLTLKIDGVEKRTETGAPYEWGHVSLTNPDTQTETLNLLPGDHTFEVIIKDSKGASTTISKIITVTEPKGPYDGTSISLPGILEMEKYDKGGQNISYFDADVENKGGEYRTDRVDITALGTDNYSIGWTSIGEWLEYTVNVEQTAEYDLTFYYSSGKAGGATIDMTTDDSPLLSNFKLPETAGWNDYTTIKKETIAMEEGEQVLRLKVIENGFNIDKIMFTQRMVTSTEDNYSSTIQLSAYPNPSEDGVFELSHEREWSVHDIHGDLLLTGKSSTVDLSETGKGMFFLTSKNHRLKMVVK